MPYLCQDNTVEQIECYTNNYDHQMVLLAHKIKADSTGKHWYVYAYWDISGNIFSIAKSDYPLHNYNGWT
jgi:hypothetical protein